VKEKLENALCVVGLLAFLYVGAYFTAARRGATFEWSGQWVAWPTYAGLPDSCEVCFRYLHDWDRSLLRPGFWAGRIPPAHWRQQQLLAVEAALRAAQAPAEQ
jgi:hypothetical protein